MSDSPTVSKLEKAAKIVGAAVTLLAALGGLGSWMFTLAMVDRDRESEELREDIDALKTQLREVSENSSREFVQLDEDFDDLHMALIALRAELTFRTATTAAPAPPTVTLRRRTPRPPVLTGAATSTSASRGGTWAEMPPPPSGGPPPPSAEVIELRDAEMAAEVYNDALERMEP